MKKHYGNISVFVIVVVLLITAATDAFSALQMTGPSQVALVILLIAATLWISEAVPLFVTSFVILILSLVWLTPVMLDNEMPVTTTVFMAPFFSDIILLFLGGFVLSAALHRFEIDEQLARWVMSKTGSSPPKLILGIMIITAVLSMFLSNTATTAMMLALCLPIIRSLPPGDKYRKAILLSVPFAANVGGMGTPIGSPPNAIAMQYMQQIGDPVSFGSWMILAIPLVVIMLVVIWLLLLTIYRGQVKQITPKFESQEIKPSLNLYIVIAVTLLTILGWLTGTIHGLTSGTVALLPVLIFFGLRILNVDDLRNLSWDVLLIMGGGLCLGKVIAESGLAIWMIGHVQTEGISLLTLAITFGVVASMMSLVMSNTAAANLIMPIIIGLGIAAMSPLLMVVAFCCSLAMALPISTPPNAIAFSSGEIKSIDLMKPGSILTIAGLVMVFTVGRWWADILNLF